MQLSCTPLAPISTTRHAPHSQRLAAHGSTLATSCSARRPTIIRHASLRNGVLKPRPLRLPCIHARNFVRENATTRSRYCISCELMPQPRGKLIRGRLRSSFHAQADSTEKAPCETAPVWRRENRHMRAVSPTNFNAQPRTTVPPGQCSTESTFYQGYCPFFAYGSSLPSSVMTTRWLPASSTMTLQSSPKSMALMMALPPCSWMMSLIAGPYVSMTS